MEWNFYKVNIIFDDENTIKAYGFPLPLNPTGYNEDYFKQRIDEANFKHQIEMSYKIVEIQTLSSKEEFKKEFKLNDDDIRDIIPYGF